jgi:hypothetical protein
MVRLFNTTIKKIKIKYRLFFICNDLVLNDLFIFYFSIEILLFLGHEE